MDIFYGLAGGLAGALLLFYAGPVLRGNGMPNPLNIRFGIILGGSVVGCFVGLGIFHDIRRRRKIRRLAHKQQDQLQYQLSDEWRTSLMSEKARKAHHRKSLQPQRQAPAFKTPTPEDQAVKS